MKNSNIRKRRLGELLLSAGVITQSTLEIAVKEQKKTGKRIGDVLIGLNFVTEFDIATTLSNQLKIEYIQLDTAIIEPDAIATVPEQIARKYRCIPLHVSKNQLSLVMADPLDFDCLKDIGFKSGREVRAFISTEGEISNAIQQHYNLDDSLEDILDETNKPAGFIEILPAVSVSQVSPSADLMEKSQRAPIIRLFNLIFTSAIKNRASDIHLDSQQYNLLVRFRIDGILREEMNLPKWSQGALVSRIKILASLDISERRLPQDGAIRARYENRDIDLRVSTLPTQYGEKVVIRILDQATGPLKIDGIGLSESHLREIFSFSKRHQGILLVTGPTGSGKTSMLYSFIHHIRSKKINIMTVEDPIEYNIGGLNQIQVKPSIGLTFANALRSILRQDPNVIMLGEIRDLETAEIAFRASMTGHLVISTLHTNSAISTISRLEDMGIPRYLISASIIGIISQRLVRTICKKCKEENIPTEKEVNHLLPLLRTNGKDIYYRGKGCSRCNQSGFYGRTGIYEILPFSTKVKEVISSGGSEESISEVAKNLGFKRMIEDGLAKVEKGVTTFDEVLRVIEVEDEARAFCPHCKKVIHLDFIACPYCEADVHLNCVSCGKHLQEDWSICPYCRTRVSRIPSEVCALENL